MKSLRAVYFEPVLQGFNKLKFYRFLAAGVLIFMLAGCASLSSPPQPSNPENICAIFKEYPSWFYDTQRTARRWGIPAAVQMAIMYQESSYNSEARPPRTMILWIIPWKRPSTAYGYSQALDGTWEMYKHSAKHYWVSRNDFADASDFIGWYSHQTYLQSGIPKYDAYQLYLAYHEGWTGYNEGTYKAKPWLMVAAQKVKTRSIVYQRQLNGCRNEFAVKKWYQ